MVLFCPDTFFQNLTPNQRTNSSNGEIPRYSKYLQGQINNLTSLDAPIKFSNVTSLKKSNHGAYIEGIEYRVFLPMLKVVAKDI